MPVPFFFNTKLWFAGLALLVLLGFICLRPLNSPSYRIIAADGLGYYSYLPARFIYHDTELRFAWFDTVFNRHYNNRLFENPSDNFMVLHGDRRINKYYPGQSLLQLPFFLVSHLAAQIFNYPADGFSFPYQLGMGLATLFYALIGLYVCSRLIGRVFRDAWLSIGVPLLIFFGTNLFTYTIYHGCYSHAYSFCMLALAFYSAFLFFNTPGNRLVYLLGLIFFSAMVLCIRPFNAILLLGLLYFYQPVSWKDLSLRGAHTWQAGFLLLLTVLAVSYSLNAIYKQTHALFINSYSGERFYFNNWSHVVDNMFGFQYGMLWYVPLILLGLCAVFFVMRQPRLLWLIVPVLALIVLYSCWWYWNIVSRVIVDSSVLLALLLAYLFNRLKNTRLHKVAIVVALLCIPLFQLKAYQLRRGILDNNYTYFKYYAKHFFTLHPVNVFPVNPATVLDQQSAFHDFEQESGPQVSETEKFEGKRSLVLNENLEYAGTNHYTIPGFFDREGFKKVKASFWIKAAGAIDNIHFVFVFKRGDSTLAYHPAYMKKENLRHGRWEFKEFGLDLPPSVRPVDQLSVYFWNPDHKNEAWIDNLKLEFFLTDGSDEVTLK
jgi:hypothetical protein